MGEESRAPVASAVETWWLKHPDLGLIEAHIGPAEKLVEIDPDFPVAAGKVEAREETGGGDNPAEAADAATAELEQQLRRLGVDGLDRRILITRNRVPVARLKNLTNTRVSLKDKHTSQLQPGKYTTLVATTDSPRLRVESNLLDSWVRTIVLKNRGEPAVELDPPAGSRAAQRYAAMAASPWKRVVYPLTVGLGKSGWALGVIILGPLLAAVVGKIVSWLRRLLPDWDLEWSWPELPLPEIPWPDISWPEWTLPEVVAPEWVVFLVEYSQLWIPVLLGVLIGAITVRRHRASQDAKRRWAQRVLEEQPASAGSGEGSSGTP